MASQWKSQNRNSKISATMCSSQYNNSTGDCHILGIALRNTNTAESVQDNTASQTNEGLLERNRTRWKYVGSTPNGAPMKTITYKFSTKKFFHVKSINDQAGNLFDEGTLWGSNVACCRRSHAGSPAAPVCAAQIAALETRSNSNHRASDGPGLDVPALRLAPDSGCGFLQSAGFRRKRARFGRAVPVRHALAPGSVELWRRPCAPCITCVSVGKGAAATSSQANLH